MKTNKKMKIEIKKSDWFNGRHEFYAIVKAKNGKVIALTEQYKTKASVFKAIKVLKALAGAEIVDSTDKKKKK